MLFAYEDTKEPILVWDDKVFVQKKYFDNATFHPKQLLFLTLSSPELKHLSRKDIFLQHPKMTKDYQIYMKILEQKKELLPLLRMTLTDDSIPDINRFPIGRTRGGAGISEQSIVPYTGKVEFLQWIRWLGDTKAIPQIRELLFHGKNERYDLNNDMTYEKDFRRIKRECIETLAELKAKDVLFEYLLRDPKPRNQHVQAAITGLMSCGLTDQDLPMMMKLVEKYESQDLEAYDLGSYYLQKLFFNPWAGMMRGREMHGVIQDIDQDAPVQRLLCKAIARIMSTKSVLMLEDIYKHAAYREMCISGIIGIRHWSALQERLLTRNISSVPHNIIQRINQAYYHGGEAPEVSEWNMLVKAPMLSAFTTRATDEMHERKRKEAIREREEKKIQLAKNAEYFKTLKPGDSIEIFVPFSYDDNQVGTVIENDGIKIIVEAKFHNKHKIGRRSFWIRNGQSSGPGGFFDDDRSNKPFFYELQTPKTPRDTRSSIPQEITIHIIGEGAPNPDDELPF